jgi:T5SS/PEP-CTERM-associated repeat protein
MCRRSTFCPIVFSLRQYGAPGSLSVVLLLLAVAAESNAADIFWINGSGGIFSTVSNWDDIPFQPDRAPGPNDVAHFGLTSNPPLQRLYTVLFTNDPTNQALVVEDDNVTFNLNGNEYTTTSSPTSIAIGTSSSFSGELTITNGTVVSAGSTIASAAGSIGVVNVSGLGSHWNNSGTFQVGGVGHGILEVTAGGRLSTENAVIGQEQGAVGEVLVDGVGSTWTNSGLIFVSSFAPGTGTLTVANGGTVSAQSGLSVRVLGTLRGDGTIVGNVGNVGVVAPGNSAGTLHINGNYTQAASGRTQIEISGTAPGSQFDMLDITGQATLDGTLQVSFIDGFSPPTGATVFEVVHADGGVIGSFDTLLLPPLPDGSAWAFAETSVSFFLILQSATLPGDYNASGTVDAADYVLWRKGGPLQNDATPGVQSNDYDVWRAHFGQTSGSGSGASANVAVPEPATLMVLVIAAAGVCSRRRRAA